ncbi:protein spaetzle [Nasonia vitripennis]|uniref:Spaetzle domain-containing protein n=1 Tax=Nasonia vitripennis TaxID=7425 RepID=A0A7M7QDA2_NASVI|nr:protein spaetzle [Nasonia vitripennis]XP_032455324.1 protein spaetzle [Nasonia vitripennis]
MKRIVLLLFVLSVSNEAEALPQLIIPVQNSSRSESGFYVQRKILTHRNFAASGDDTAGRTDAGKIIFPSDDGDFPTPQFPVRPHSGCENSTFCENTPNYPKEYLQAALRTNKDLKFFSSDDLVLPDVLVHRVNALPDDDAPLCEATEKVVYPKVAQSKDKEWLFVVNQEGFSQGVRVETCGKENNACNLIEGFAEGYKTVCKQKYIYRQLVALSTIGQLKPEKFRFPASCCCHIKFTGNPLGLRMGSSLGKKAPELPSSKANRGK